MFEGLFQPVHLILVLLIVLLIFGPGKLPQIGAGLGKSIRDFKKALSGKDEIELKPEPEDKKTEEKK
ncbi:MAG: twin-arginine translocase TatA/TatE family subunit [Nitrospiraceae bacterium]|nr:twin-arginine translocase TatA/TatE family subunit [Nitrospiraceae bacterium]MDA8325285.1 twin-arginine translocase TatA/TatE family subunit [Nitrospiraceae bacterium]